MEDRSDAEWGDPFDDAELPRRDDIPSPGFTPPSVANADAEITAFVPAFRRRRMRQWYVTAATAVVVYIAAGAGLVLWAVNMGGDETRKYGIIPFFWWIAIGVAGFFALRRLARWAMAPDVADTRVGKWTASRAAPRGYAGSMGVDLALPVEELARSLIDIESVSGGETRIADVVESALRELRHLEVVRDGDAVVARTIIGRSERVALVGHLDTVPVRGNIPGRIDDGVLWGRGAVDMKAGVAVLLSLAAELDAPSRDVTWIFYDHEEVDAIYNGLGRLARNRPDLLEVDFAVLGEPTSARYRGRLQRDAARRGDDPRRRRALRAGVEGRQRDPSSPRRCSRGSRSTSRQPCRSTGSTTARDSTPCASPAASRTT